ncbi:hypothetical protein MLJ27_00005, partial [Escherichia coli]|nr:hypothetical protein [Escherichia coli]MCV1580932.1 hypothetical protein [Escherichia coli]
HQIMRKVILTDGLFALAQKKMPDATLRVLYSHICQIQQRIRLPQLAHFHTCPPYQKFILKLLNNHFPAN